MIISALPFSEVRLFLSKLTEERGASRLLVVALAVVSVFLVLCVLLLLSTETGMTAEGETDSEVEFEEEMTLEESGEDTPIIGGDITVMLVVI